MTDSYSVQIDLSEVQISIVHKFIVSQKDEPSILHKHPCYELVCVEKNQGNHFLIIPPHREHFAVDTEKDDVLFVNSFLFSLNDKAPKTSIYNVLKSYTEPTQIPDTFNGVERMRNIRDIVGDSSFGGREQLKAELQLLLVLICRALDTFEDKNQTRKQSLDEIRLCILEDYFTYNFSNPECSKRELAKLLGVCERQLSRIIYEKYNSSFTDVLLSMRMNTAKALIEDKGLSPKEVAEKVGYQSDTAFNRAYKRYFKSNGTENEK